MGVFSQFGDCVCPPCLCEHHGAAYAARATDDDMKSMTVASAPFVDGATIVSQTILITEQCCIVVMAASLVDYPIHPNVIEIERPIGTIRTTEEHYVDTNDLMLHNHAVWEVLNPGTYTYFLVNRMGATLDVYSAWLKIIASDCEG